MSIEPGTIVEQYKVQEIIGSGAMGEVFLAEDQGLGRKVALKILSDVHRDNPELRARFIREARAVAAISHPNVVQVFSIGEFDGRPFFAMEYLAGSDLGSIVREQGAQSVAATVSAVLDSARGLQAAAHARLIHRDVKPTNLVRLHTGVVKVTDFGLAKPAHATDDPALTALGVVVGTPDYIAPEQARGDDIDTRVDVYALGCTTYFLLTGKPPFRKGNDEDDKYIKVVARHLRDPAPDARRLAPATDDELAELVLRMMAKSADQRPTYDDLIAQLEGLKARLAKNGPARVRPKAAAGASTAAAKRSSTSSQPPSYSDSLEAMAQGGTGWLWITSGIAAVIFAIGLVLTLLPARTLEAAAVAHDDAGAASPHEPSAPAGMLLVAAAGNRPAFYVDRAPVSNRAYAELNPGHHVPADEAQAPLIGLSYTAARDYAHARGKRLIRDAEWQSALDTFGFAPAGMRYWEWVDDGTEDSARDHAVRRVEGGVSRHPSHGDKYTTFRLAQDLP